MPNGSYVLCPYYVASKKTAITCEDCIREFFSNDAKNRQEKEYCSGNWEKCQYAAELGKMYEQISGMSDSAIQIRKLKFYNEAKATEITRIKRKISKDRARQEQDKRDVYALKHQLQIAKQEGSQIRKKAIESDTIYQEKIKGLEAFIGMLCQQYGIDEFTLRAVRDYRIKYKTICKISEDGNTVIIRRKKIKEKKHANRNKRSSAEIPGTGKAEAGEAKQSEEAAGSSCRGEAAGEAEQVQEQET